MADQDYSKLITEYERYLLTEISGLRQDRDKFSANAESLNPATFRVLYVFDEKIRILQSAYDKFKLLFPGVDSNKRASEGQLAPKAQKQRTKSEEDLMWESPRIRPIR